MRGLFLGLGLRFVGMHLGEEPVFTDFLGFVSHVKHSEVSRPFPMASADAPGTLGVLCHGCSCLWLTQLGCCWSGENGECLAKRDNLLTEYRQEKIRAVCPVSSIVLCILCMHGGSPRSLPTTL